MNRPPDHNALAGFVAQALDALVAQLVTDAYAAIRLAGERDYLDGDDVEAIYRHVAASVTQHRLQPPRLAAIIEACHRLNVPVVL